MMGPIASYGHFISRYHDSVWVEPLEAFWGIFGHFVTHIAHFDLSTSYPHFPSTFSDPILKF